MKFYSINKEGYSKGVNLFLFSLITMVVCCASVGSVGNKMVNNTDKSGVIYGTGAVANDTTAKSDP